MPGGKTSAANTIRSRIGEMRDAALRKGPLRRVPDAALGALAVIACIAVAFALLTWWPKGASSGFAISSSSEHAATTAAQPQTDSLRSQTDDIALPKTVTVDVAGAVASPGVYELPEGSRVIAAVEAAGGVAEDAETAPVNLARVLVDGEQVYIPTSDEAAAPVQPLQAQASTQTSAQSTPALVDINTASAAELETLPGIGPSTAQKIIADREKNGPFSSKEDLKRVSGIGDKKYAALADAITAS